MRTTTIATVATVVLALLIVAKTRTVGLTQATGNPVQNTMSIYDLDVGRAGNPAALMMGQRISQGFAR